MNLLSMAEEGTLENSVPCGLGTAEEEDPGC